MNRHLSDRSRTSIVAVVLLAVAAYAVFGFQHGFEGQVGWYLTLLPGSIAAAGISGLIQKAIPGAKSGTFWGLPQLPVVFRNLISLHQGASFRRQRFEANLSGHNRTQSL